MKWVPGVSTQAAIGTFPTNLPSTKTSASGTLLSIDVIAFSPAPVRFVGAVGAGDATGATVGSADTATVGAIGTAGATAEVGDGATGGTGAARSGGRGTGPVAGRGL